MGVGETRTKQNKEQAGRHPPRARHDAIGHTQQTHPCMQGTMPRVAAAAFRPAIYLSLSRRAAGRAVLAASPRHEPPDDGADIWWLPLTYDAATAATSTNPGQRRQHPHQVHRDVSNAFLRHVISHYTSEPVEALQFSRTEHGKPYLAGGLVKFNMSHADGLVGGTSMHSRSFPILLFPSLSFPSHSSHRDSHAPIVLLRFRQSPSRNARSASTSSCRTAGCGRSATS